MKLGIIGLSLSGRSTVFEVLTRQSVGDGVSRTEDRMAVVRVPDERVDVLSGMFEPKKTIYAQVEYFLPGTGKGSGSGSGGGGRKKDEAGWLAVKECDALIQVVRNHGPDRDPVRDFRALEQELILSDLVQVEKRREKIELEQKRGKKMNAEEQELFRECQRLLEEGECPLRRAPSVAGNKLLKGFSFLSAKPMLVLFNNEETEGGLPELGEIGEQERCMVVRGKLEQELARMSPEEAAEFLAEYGIERSGMDRVIQASYEALGLMSFFTVGSDEVRAWTIRRGTPAAEAAGTIHSDMQKGFIRAEVVSYHDLIDAGGLPEARKRGRLRLEGKTYPVADGDVINVRFNV